MLDIEKAVHAAAYLVEKAGGCLRRRQLCRQLYLSERTFLLFHSDSFTGDRIVATKDGPALEERQGILSASELHDPWSRWLEFGDEETALSRNRSGNSTGMLVEDFDALSLADLIHLTSTVMQELAISPSSQAFLTSELIQFLLDVTSNDSLELASLPMDMWLRLSVAFSPMFVSF